MRDAYHRDVILRDIFMALFRPGTTLYLASARELREFMEILDTYWIKVFYGLRARARVEQYTYVRKAVALPNIRLDLIRSLFAW